MLRTILVFIVGLLVGANAVYYAMTRDRPPVDRSPTEVPQVVDPQQPSRDVTDAAPTAPSAMPTAPMGERTLPPASGGMPPATIAPQPPGASLSMPVSGVKPAQLTDTFNDLRGSTRIHEALDIMAPRGTPVVATADGKIAKLFTSDQGGLTLYQFDPTGTFAYYYAHLDTYAPGLAEGQQLRRGDPVGTVGSTGNASPEAPHLHFAIFALGPEKNWWKGTPVNPYPLLTGKPATSKPPVSPPIAGN